MTRRRPHLNTDWGRLHPVTWLDHHIRQWPERCTTCGYHPHHQGHHPDCPHNPDRPEPRP